MTSATMNKHLFISVLLLLLFCGSVMAAEMNNTAMDETGKSASSVLKWIYEQVTLVFWYIVPIGLVIGAAYMALGGSAASAEGQKKIMNVLKGVAALYICLWVVTSIKAL